MGLTIGNYIGIGKNSGISWQTYWISQDEVVDFFDLSRLNQDGNCIGKKAGNVLIIGGTPGSETYKMPVTAENIAADTDYIWFKIDGTQRTVTKAELNGYDLPHTPVYYEDDEPNNLKYIVFLNSTPVGSKMTRLHKDFRLPIMWSGIWNDSGFEKSNRPDTEQILWLPEAVISSCVISNSNRDKIVATFSSTLDETSVPATTAFAIASKTVTNVAITGAVLTLTIDSNFDYADAVSFTYTKPASNQLKSASGLTYGSFVHAAITNSIEYPNFYADGNTKAWKDNTDIATITKDVNNYVDRINHKLGGAIYFTGTGTGRPQLQANNELLYDGEDDKLTASASVAAALPITMYVVFRVITHRYPRAIVQWNPSYQTGFLVGGSSANKVKVYHGVTSQDWSTLSPNTLNIAVMKIQGADSTMSINGAAETIFDSGSSVGAFTVLSIFSGAVGYVNGAEKELIFRTGGDTPENRLKGYNYLKAKHGL